MAEGTIRISHNATVIGHYELLKKPFCGLCGQPNVTEAMCFRKHNLDWFSKVYSLGIYYPKNMVAPDLLSEHILNLKSDPLYAIPIGKSMAIAAREIYPDLLRADGIVPIPLHQAESDKRGFNQSKLLAEVLSQHTKLPVINALGKTKDGSLQHLTFQQRMQAVKGLYELRSDADVSGKTLLIVDDVFAAGATCSESARLLLKGGAKSAIVFVAGRTIYAKGK